MFQGVPFGEAPGDEGYKHDLYHPSYQKLFGEIGNCTCGDGECRVTDWRETTIGSPKGYDVIVDRHWLALPGDVWMPDDPKTIPKDLLRERAHVCAYNYGIFPLISCALINTTQV
ncbi:MAG TPA: hypothetical protein VMH91_02170 [Candidatus Paceibacterota bacterium]|nr:hypothetical protein [Candidatus Paceibacterota bacterium]